jgi:transposase
MQDAAAPRPTQAAIRIDLGAIFISLELSRSSWVITSLSPGAGEKMSKHTVAAGDVAGLLKRFGQFKERRGGGRARTFRSLSSKRLDWTGSGSTACLRAKGSKATSSIPRRF